MVLSLTLANAMVQKGTAVQCQPLRGRDIRRRQGHGRQTTTHRLTNTHTHTLSNTHYSFTDRENLLTTPKNVHVTLQAAD